MPSEISSSSRRTRFMNAINHSYPEMRPSYPGIRLPHPHRIPARAVGLTRRQLKLVDHIDRAGAQLNRFVKQVQRTPPKEVSLERTVAMISSGRSEISSKLRTEPLAWLLLDGVGLDGPRRRFHPRPTHQPQPGTRNLSGSLGSLCLLASAILGQQLLV